MKKVTINRINSSLDNVYDVLICSASFEDRSVCIPNKVKRKNFKKIIVLENSNGSDLIKNNAKKISELYKQKVVNLKIDYSDSLSLADRIVKEVNSISAKAKKISVLLDITTFTHETLMVCLKVMRINSKIRRVTCVYVTASEYCPGYQISNKWLSRGCKNVHPILGYPGMLLPSLRTHLIVIVGYEYNRAFEMISALEPNSISLVYGSPDDALTEKDKEANSIFNDLIKQMAFEFSNIESSTIPCGNPNQTSLELQKIYDCHDNDNIIVVPMNNKMSTLGVELSTRKNERVQICYAPAVVYNEANYSIPGKDCYIFELNLNE